MARPRLQSVGQDAPPTPLPLPPPPPLPPPAPLPPPPPSSSPHSPPPRTGVNSGWCGGTLRVPLGSSTALSATQFLHAWLRPFLNPSKPSAGILCGLSPPFELIVPNFVASSSRTTIQPFSCPPEEPSPSSNSPLHHPPRQALFPHMCHEPREQYPPSPHRRLNALGVCLGERVVGVREGVWPSRFRFRQPRRRRSMKW